MDILYITVVLCNILLLSNTVYSDEKIEVEEEFTKISIELSINNFDSHINKQSHLVMFYAPWCGHCKRLHPTWEKYAASKSSGSDVGIGKVDCTEHSSLCSKHDVNGYPTIKLFKKGSESGIKFKGSRDVESFNAFIREQMNISEKPAKPKESVVVIEHTEESFSKKGKIGLHFIKFYAPWCGHCQKLAPTWESLGEELKENKKVSIGKVDCTKFKSICNKYEIKGYPSMLWLSEGKMVAKYSGDRSLQSLSKYVKEKIHSAVPEIQAAAIVKSSVITLNPDTFETEISSGVAMVKFFAPWCGHCKRLAPVYEELGTKFEDNTAVKIARIDCTLDNNRDFCGKQSVDGFPSLFLYKDGKKMIEYEGDRALINLEKFINGYLSHDEL